MHYINKLLERVEPKARHLSIKAQILIEAGDYESVLESLFHTVELGLQNPERFKTMVLEENIFKSLRSLTKFPQLIKKIENN